MVSLMRNETKASPHHHADFFRTLNADETNQENLITPLVVNGSDTSCVAPICHSVPEHAIHTSLPVP